MERFPCRLVGENWCGTILCAHPARCGKDVSGSENNLFEEVDTSRVGSLVGKRGDPRCCHNRLCRDAASATRSRQLAKAMLALF